MDLELTKAIICTPEEELCHLAGTDVQMSHRGIVFMVF